MIYLYTKSTYIYVYLYISLYIDMGTLNITLRVNFGYFATLLCWAIQWGFS